MKFLDNQDIDASFKPFGGELPCTVKKTITFAGGTADAWGNDGGALDGGVLFTVTGLVKMSMLAICKTDLGGANATIEAGITGDTAIFLPIETATQIDLGQIWVNDAANGTYIILGAENAAAGNMPLYLLNGNDIILTVKTANVTSGKLDFYAYYRPMSDDAIVTPSSL